jgi:hypothetical protein
MTAYDRCPALLISFSNVDLTRVFYCRLWHGTPCKFLRDDHGKTIDVNSGMAGFAGQKKTPESKEEIMPQLVPTCNSKQKKGDRYGKAHNHHGTG